VDPIPPKNDQERLIPMSPELVKVEVQRRARGTGKGVPLSVRDDLPHPLRKHRPERDES
jgi:hypothetical protein